MHLIQVFTPVKVVCFCNNVPFTTLYMTELAYLILGNTFSC
jgi:hypothetical protein